MFPSRYRYNAFNDSPNFVRITERHLVPFVSPYYIQLNEVPDKADPSDIIVKEVSTGTVYTEVAADPAAGEYRPDYHTRADGDANWNTGLMEFSPANAGAFVEIAYTGTGGLASVASPHIPSWMLDYGDGSDGNMVIADGQSLGGLIQAKSFVLPSGVTANITTQGLPLKILSQGAVIIEGVINGKGMGARRSELAVTGNNGSNAAGAISGWLLGGGISGGGGSGGTGGTYVTYSDGNGNFIGVYPATLGGAAAYNGVPITLDETSVPLLARAGQGCVGAAGGGKSSGGYGGGALVIAAPEIFLTGTIDVSGNDGGYIQTVGIGGGGGGGTVIMAGKTVRNEGVINVTGGAKNSSAGDGAEVTTDGSPGWFYIFELGVTI